MATVYRSVAVPCERFIFKQASIFKDILSYDDFGLIIWNLILYFLGIFVCRSKRHIGEGPGRSRGRSKIRWRGGIEKFTGVQLHQIEQNGPH